MRRLEILSLREYVALVGGPALPPVTLGDVLADPGGLSERVADAVQASGRRVLALFKDYLRRGSYPHFLEYEREEDYLLTVEQNARTCIESDLPAVRPALTGRSVQKMRRLLSVLAASVPFVPDWKRLAALVDVSDERTLKGYLDYLVQGGILRILRGSSRGLRTLEKPEKVYLNSPSLCHALAPGAAPEIGTLRETFLLAMLSVDHDVVAPVSGDFLVDDELVLEVGGRSKAARPIRGQPNARLVVDDLEIGTRSRIPLWLFGFLY